MKPIARVAGYELKKLIGTGGLTETYRARGQRSGGLRSVAVKLLRLDRLPEEARELAGRRFIAAGQRARAATVGGMAQVIEVADSPSGPYVASQIVPGIDLAGLVHFSRKRAHGGSAIDPSLVRALGAQVARILTSAHEATPALYHFGLSPGNVRITPAAEVVALDFGLAASLRATPDQRMAKWYFLPPELLATDAAEGTPDGCGPAADLYSLGGLLFFLLTGRPPVEAATLAELLERAWEPLPILTGIPADLAQAIQTLTAPDPQQRPASAREAAEMLSGNMASAHQRHEHIAAALGKLGIDWRARRAATESGADSGVYGTGAATGVLARPQIASRRTGRRWQWPVLAGAAVAVALLAWLSLRTQHGQDAGLASTTRQERADEPSLRQPLNRNEIPANYLQPAQAGLAADAGAPLDRVYVPMPKQKLPRVPNRLNIDTDPSGADVWVDGVLRGKTPTDLVLGPGGHRVVTFKDGYLMQRDVYDTTEGEWVRQHLQPFPLPQKGEAYVNVHCRGTRRYPVFIDDEDIGRLCPVTMVPVRPGLRRIGVFVPARRATVAVEVTVPPGPKPTVVTVND